MAPESKMLEIAGTLAVLEKLSSLLGTLNFIWATTVLLGGFAIDLVGEDFWFVTVLIAVEGIRIFGRLGELQRSSYEFMNIGNFFPVFLQEISALMAMIVIPSSKLLIPSAKLFSKLGSNKKARNRTMALSLFYWVALTESSMVVSGLILRICLGISPFPWSGVFLPWTRRLSGVSEVREEYNVDDSQIGTLDGFFHHIYSRCVTGSIFDIRNITIVSYSVELLQSSNPGEQLKGAKLLRGLVQENQRALERLRSIRTIRSVVEMLIDMLIRDWKASGIRLAAAEIISNLVKIGQNRTLVMAAPNSMESIASLLYDGNQVEINSSQNRTQSSPKYPYSDFSKTGLSILKLLASDHDNRAKMGSNRGLLLKIITLTESNTPELDLRKLAIETLTSIARDQDFREIIGCIDEVLHNFFSLFVDTPIGNEELVPKAGEALGFLLLNNNQNSEIMKSIRRAYFRYLIPRLIPLLNEERRGTYAAIILRNLSAYLEAHPNENIDELNMIGKAAAQVVDLVTEKEGVHQEAAIGLAAQIFKFLSQEDYGRVMTQPRAGWLISTLLYVLRQHASRELPNIRRFSILLLIAIMRMDIPIITWELGMNLRNALEGAMNTTSVLESYSTFSGTIGLRSDSMAIPFLAQSAIGLLDN